MNERREREEGKGGGGREGGWFLSTDRALILPLYLSLVNEVRRLLKYTPPPPPRDSFCPPPSRDTALLSESLPDPPRPHLLGLCFNKNSPTPPPQISPIQWLFVNNKNFVATKAQQEWSDHTSSGPQAVDYTRSYCERPFSCKAPCEVDECVASSKPRI